MATTTGGTTESKAEQAGDSTSLEGLARVGLIAYGVVHLLIGWLALQIAWGASASKSADTSGALRTLARSALRQDPAVGGRRRPGGARALAGQRSHLGLSQP